MACNFPIYLFCFHGCSTELKIVHAAVAASNGQIYLGQFLQTLGDMNDDYEGVLFAVEQRNSLRRLRDFDFLLK